MGPEMPTPSVPPRAWRGPVALALLAGALFFVRLGKDVPFSRHEALLAETARNMVLDRPAELADGSRPSPYVVPNFGGAPRLRKTPLGYWLAAGAAHLTGRVDEWSARLPSALAAAGTVLMVTLLVRRWTDGRTALWAGAALVTSMGFLLAGRQALADMPMTGSTTAAVAAAWMAVETRGRRRFGWLVAAGAAGGLAMLAKGPAPLLVFPGPCAVAGGLIAWRLVRDRRAGRRVRDEWAWTLASLAAALVVFLVVVVPWPTYVYLRVPQALAAWKAESVDRSLGEYGHQEPVYFYMVRLLALAAPWAAFLAWGLASAARRARRDEAARPWLLFLAGWLAGPLLLFSLAAGKQDHYILPALPAAAVYTGLAMSRLTSRCADGTGRAGRWMVLGHGAAAVLVGLAGVGAWGAWRAAPGWLAALGLPEALATEAALGPVAVLGLVGIAGGAAAAVLAARRRTAGGMAVLFAAFAAAFLGAWPTLMGPMDRSTTVVRFAGEVRRLVPAEAPLLAFVDVNHTMVFYVERALPAPVHPAQVETRAKGEDVFFLVCAEKQWPALAGVEGLTVVVHVRDRWRADGGFRLLRGGGADQETYDDDDPAPVGSADPDAARDR